MAHIYHYTSGFGLACILFDGRLRAFAGEGGGQAAVWFTASEHWDPTARQSHESLLGADWGRWRIKVDEDAASAGFAAFRQVEPGAAEFLEEIGLQRGADPEAWRVRFSDLDYVDWKAVEREEADSWVIVKWEHVVKLCCELRGARWLLGINQKS
jgi:hypothetical protein